MLVHKDQETLPLQIHLKEMMAVPEELWAAEAAELLKLEVPMDLV